MFNYISLIHFPFYSLYQMKSSDYIFIWYLYYY